MKFYKITRLTPVVSLVPLFAFSLIESAQHLALTWKLFLAYGLFSPLRELEGDLKINLTPRLMFEMEWIYKLKLDPE